MEIPKTVKYYLGVFVAAFLGLIGFFTLRSHDKQKDINNASTILSPNETERVIVDPSRHVITLVTPTHTKTMTLPDRPSVISLMKNDGLKIVSPQYGTELRPFLGAAYTLKGGVILGGLDLAYWKSLDFAMGLSVNPKFVQDTGIFVGFSYQAYSNTSVGIGLDNHVTPIVFVKVRI